VGETLAETIREITRKHLNNGGLLLGQAISAVGWVNQTVPDCQNIVELPMADVAGSGIAVGTAIAGRRPIFILRFQDFIYLASSPIFNYAAKSKEFTGKGTPIFIRALAGENHGLGIVHSGCLHSLAMHTPGLRVYAPMTPNEYREAWRAFMACDEPFYVSEHRNGFQQIDEMPDIIVSEPDITVFAISAARYSVLEAVEMLKDEDIRCNVVHIWQLKPLDMTARLWDSLYSSGMGLVVDSDFEMCGASEHIACELMKVIDAPVRALGRSDNSLGIGQHLKYGTPQAVRIAGSIRNMVKRGAECQN
jgi:pyruvate/2-oxoglutarate/acetoin dehydrogenase E1 component